MIFKSLTFENQNFHLNEFVYPFCVRVSLIDQLSATQSFSMKSDQRFMPLSDNFKNKRDNFCKIEFKYSLKTFIS